MRRPVTSAEMKKYKARQMSLAELKEFDANLSSSGLASELRRPSPEDFISALRPEHFDDAFDTETLLSFVKGELDDETYTLVSSFRKVDSDLDETLTVMEAAKRQVDASLASSRHQKSVKAQKSWFRFGGLGIATASIAIILIMVLRPTDRIGVTVASIDSLLHSSTISAMTPEAIDALNRGSVDLTNDAKIELASLVRSTKDKLQMTPAACLVLPTSSINLTWKGIKSKQVRCRLLDSKGTKLAEANVMKSNTWTYAHQLPSGDFSWTVEWVNAKGQTKSASRHFRVVNNKRAKEVAEELISTQDAVSRAVILAKNGFSAQSLELIDSVANSKQAAPGLQKLRDSIAATGQSAMA